MTFCGNDTRDISVVVQGAVDRKITLCCLASIRTNFPGAEVILSTWEGSERTGLDYDVLVLSKDPGAGVCDEVAGTWNNVNRQLVSTAAGLRSASRSFILKTRTDIIFQNADFLEYFGKYDQVPSPFFQNRLLICNYYTRNPRVLSLCFHPSDWLVFGRSEDVRNYYRDIPLMSDQEINWFRTRQKASTFYTNYICRFTPEQFIFLGFLRRYQQIDMRCYYDRSSKLVEQAERSISKCFVVLDYGKQLKIKFVKYAPNRYSEKHTLLSHRQWRGLYEHYCLGRRSIRWRCGLAWVRVLRIFTDIRTGLVRILSILGLKELVKGVLGAIRK